LVPVEMPTITKAVLKKPQYGEFFGIGFMVDSHYFCEGQGKKVQAINKDAAYEFWLKMQENPWWKRLLGKPKYKIPMREQTPDDIYESYEVFDKVN